MEPPAAQRARSLWLMTEPLHAVCYFDDDCRALGKSLGLRGFWMGYFAARTAPLGAVEPAAATAVLGVFAPGMVARALPAAWSTVSPAHVLDERGTRAARALRTIAPDLDRSATALLPRLQALVDAAPDTGRPLFAANRALCDHADPVERLWQLATTLREFRGEAHLAALADRELDGCEALVLTAATGRVPEGTTREDRGWTEGSGQPPRTACTAATSSTRTGTPPPRARTNAPASRRRPTVSPPGSSVPSPRRTPTTCWSSCTRSSAASWPRTYSPSPIPSACPARTRRSDLRTEPPAGHPHPPPAHPVPPPPVGTTGTSRRPATRPADFEGNAPH
ncbi:hypothetical protein O1L55_39800 [Streptomyces albulus]|nr:hypothetical protein [Streptomyces noursei]